MQRLRKSVVTEKCQDLHKFVKENSFYDTEILRKAYELILDNSTLFYEILADAFIKARQRQDINSNESFVE